MKRLFTFVLYLSALYALLCLQGRYPWFVAVTMAYLYPVAAFLWYKAFLKKEKRKGIPATVAWCTVAAIALPVAAHFSSARIIDDAGPKRQLVHPFYPAIPVVYAKADKITGLPPQPAAEWYSNVYYRGGIEKAENIYLLQNEKNGQVRLHLYDANNKKYLVTEAEQLTIIERKFDIGILHGIRYTKAGVCSTIDFYGTDMNKEGYTYRRIHRWLFDVYD